MTRPRRTVSSLFFVSMLVLVLGVGAVTPGEAAPSRAQPHWIRYHQADFRVPAGEGCAFAVKEHVLRDREFYKTVSTYANGKPRTELFKGPLVMRLTNVRTGTSLRRNLSGRAIETFHRNGDFDSLTVLHGHFGTTLPKGSEPGHGLYYVGGRWSSLSINADGTRTLVLGPHGTARNLCPALARTRR
jgi:hypothetical protein